MQRRYICRQCKKVVRTSVPPYRLTKYPHSAFNTELCGTCLHRIKIMLNACPNYYIQMVKEGKMVELV